MLHFKLLEFLFTFDSVFSNASAKVINRHVIVLLLLLFITIKCQDLATMLMIRSDNDVSYISLL